MTAPSLAGYHDVFRRSAVEGRFHSQKIRGFIGMSVLRFANLLPIDREIFPQLVRIGIDGEFEFLLEVFLFSIFTTPFEVKTGYERELGLQSASLFSKFVKPGSATDRKAVGRHFNVQSVGFTIYSAHAF